IRLTRATHHSHRGFPDPSSQHVRHAPAPQVGAPSRTIARLPPSQGSRNIDADRRFALRPRSVSAWSSSRAGTRARRTPLLPHTQTALRSRLARRTSAATELDTDFDTHVGNPFPCDSDADTHSRTATWLDSEWPYRLRARQGTASKRLAARF